MGIRDRTGSFVLFSFISRLSSHLWTHPQLLRAPRDTDGTEQETYLNTL